VKRFFVVPMLIAALAVPAAATAFETTAKVDSAKRGTAFSVSFIVVKENGHATEIRKFKFKNLKIDCAEGPVLLSGGPFKLQVANNRFHDSFDNGIGGNLRINGRFVNPNKVKGKIRADGTFNNDNGPDFTNCTGARRYTAA
jgi:hypothetical protein